MANLIQIRRDTRQAWINAQEAYPNTPLLAQGELGFEHDTGRLKIGDGITFWKDLDYVNPDILPSSAEGVLINDGNGNLSWAIIPAGFSGNYNELTNKPVLASVANTGSYTDLINKPTIPSDVSDLTDNTDKFGPVNDFNAIADKLFGFDFGPIANVTANSKIEWILLSIDVDNGTITSPVNIDHDAGTLI